MFIEKETSYVDAQEAARMLGVNKRAVRTASNYRLVAQAEKGRE